jgi:hypothetical protein
MIVRLVSASFLASILLLAPAKSQEGEMEDLRTYCKSDIERLCQGVEPGGGRIIKCLKAHEKEMSVGCALALKKLKEKRQ